MNDLSNEALTILRYVCKHQGDVCSGEFGASLFTARGIAKLQKVDAVVPVLDELVEHKFLKKSRIFYKSPKYKINPKKLEDACELVEAKDSDVYNQEYRDALDNEIKKYKRFVITTYVMGKEAHKPFLESVKNYAKRNKALMLLLPCEDVANRGKKSDPLGLSEDLKDFRVVFKDTYLNKNLCLCALKVSAKQINPLCGLDRMTTTRDASIIVAAPKVFLKYIPNLHENVPPALMTTGAITVNNYDNDRYMSKRTSALAENDHSYGIVVVEVEDDRIFHFRHIQASEEGTLTDLGVEYLPDGTINKMKNTVMVMGDSHISYHDEDLHNKVMELAQNTHVNKVILHDVFNGTSITHHDIGKNITRAIKAGENRLGLEDECIAVKNYIKDIENRGMEVFIPEANHHEHLMKYLEQGRYMSDPMNHKFSLKLAAKAIDGVNPLQYAIEGLLGYSSNKVHWIDTDKSCNFYGVECGIHGHHGANGGRGNIATFNKGVGNCVTAHTHSAAIVRDSYCVGTVGKMDMGYNHGLSSWTRTCCLIYSNGTKQLVNFIFNSQGEYSYTIE